MQQRVENVELEPSEMMLSIFCNITLRLHSTINNILNTNMVHLMLQENNKEASLHFIKFYEYLSIYGGWEFDSLPSLQWFLTPFLSNPRQSLTLRDIPPNSLNYWSPLTEKGDTSLLLNIVKRQILTCFVGKIFVCKIFVSKIFVSKIFVSKKLCQIYKRCKNDKCCPWSK